MNSKNSERRAFRLELVPQKRLAMAREDPHSPPGLILAAAEDVFAELGYSGATTREIAKRSGVNIANIHYYWGSKEELWHAVIYNVMTQITESSKSLMLIPSEKVGSSLKDIIDKIVDILADNPNYARIFQHGAIRGYSDEVAKQLTIPLLEIGMSFLKGYMTEGIGEDQDPALLLFSLTGAIAIFFLEQDAVRVIFNEDTDSLSPAFRQKLKETLYYVVTQVIGLEKKAS